MNPTVRWFRPEWLAVVVLLAGCSKTVVPKIETHPASVTVNGFVPGSAPGSAQLSVSALDNHGALIESAVLTEPALSGMSVVAPAGLRTQSAARLTASITGTASVCGNIVSLGAVTAAITLDATGSMSYTDPQQLRRDAAKQFIARMAGRDSAAVSSFETSLGPSPGYRAIHVWQDFTSAHAPLDSAVDFATYEGGGTPLWDAADDSRQFLLGHAGANRIAVILTDGGDNASSIGTDEVVANARAAGVRMFMIGLGPDAYIDGSGMKDVASRTGGVFARADKADELKGLFDGVFNASRAAGCLSIVVQVDGAIPPPGTSLQGLLTVKVDGTPVSGRFRVDF
jgi:hypothetical protein